MREGCRQMLDRIQRLVRGAGRTWSFLAILIPVAFPSLCSGQSADILTRMGLSSDATHI